MNGFEVVLLTYPKVVEDGSSSHNKKDERPPMTGSVDEIGGDLRRIKDMGVDGYSFLPIGRNVDKMIDTTKQLSEFCVLLLARDNLSERLECHQAVDCLKMFTQANDS